jgi:hypothetical protein
MYFGHCVRCAIPRSGQPRPTGSTFVRNAKRRGRTTVRPHDSTPGVAVRKLPLPILHGTSHPLLTRVDFLASPCVPSPISAIRTPRLPLLLQGEKGAGGMRGNGARECRTSLISPKNSPLESTPPQGSHTRDGWSAYYIVPPDVCDTTCNEKFAPNKPLFTRPVSRLPVSAPPL